MQLTDKELVDLIQNGEKVHFEGKDASGGLPGNLWDSYSSFANTDGGVIVLGLDVHDCVREVVANALIHADYHGRRGIVIDRNFENITISNPGCLRVSKDVAVDGGTSDPRNIKIFNIFALINVGERSGFGLNNVFNI